MGIAKKTGIGSMNMLSEYCVRMGHSCTAHEYTDHTTTPAQASERAGRVSMLRVIYRACAPRGRKA